MAKKTKGTRVELANRLATAEHELQRVQRAIADGVADRVAYLAARMNVRETQAEVWRFLRGEGADPL